MKTKNTHLKETVEPGVFIPWQTVDVEIHSFTDIGLKVVINNEYMGLVYGNQVYGDYKKGETFKAYIKLVRDDGKIDVSLQPPQDKHVITTTNKILEHLKAAGGKSKFNDKSSPDEIKKEFQVSKKVFKQSIGKLYKHHIIKITEQGIELIK